jgi:tripartite-type tricarboxylate transporter receptor subunit TctC
MTAAVEQAWNDPTYQEFLKNASYLDREGFAAPAEFQTLIDNEYVTFDTYLRGIGVIK